MIRAIRPQAMAQDDASLVSGWNVSPNVAYTVQLNPGSSACGVLVYNEDQTAIIASGAGLVGTGQPVILHPYSGRTIGMIDADLGWHLLLSTDGTEYPRTIKIGPAVDLPDEIHPIYADDALAVVSATAGVNDHAHYIDDISVTCPLGLGAGLGDVASVPVDGVAVAGQVESITWTATPNGTSDAAVVRRYVAIAPEPHVDPVTIVPPDVEDDTAETDAETEATGNVLANDDEDLAIVAVNGLTANVGTPVAGSDGGLFVIAEDGAWTFDPDGDFAALSGSETAETSVTYHASDGVAESMATLTVTVSAGGVITDPMWADVALLIQAPETGSTIADAKGKTVTAQGNVAASTVLGYPTIYFDGSGDRLDVGAVSDFKFLHNGSNWTLEFIAKPSAVATDDVILDTTRGTTSNSGIFIAYSSGKIRVFITRSVSSSYVVDSVLNYTFTAGVEKTVCLEYNHSLTTGTLKMYVDGALAASANKTSNAPSTGNHQQMMIGMFSTAAPTAAYTGHIRAIRATQGVRYGADHTPPTWPLPTS